MSVTPIGTANAESLPKQESLFAAKEAYTQYLYGVQTLYDPESTRPLHTAVDTDIMIGTVAASASHMIWSGLRDTIRSAIDGDAVEGSRDIVVDAKNFTDNSRALRSFLDEYYLTESDSVQRLNRYFDKFRPAPFLDPNLYRQLCENRSDRLTATRLSGGFVISNFFKTDQAEGNENQIIGIFIPKKNWDSKHSRSVAS